MHSIPEKLTLKEIRQHERDMIKNVILDSYDELMPFDAVMKKCIRGRKYPSFVNLKSLSDFTDGFMVFKGDHKGAKELQSFLKGYQMEVLRPNAT